MLGLISWLWKSKNDKVKDVTVLTDDKTSLKNKTKPLQCNMCESKKNIITSKDEPPICIRCASRAM